MQYSIMSERPLKTYYLIYSFMSVVIVLGMTIISITSISIQGGRPATIAEEFWQMPNLQNDSRLEAITQTNVQVKKGVHNYNIMSKIHRQEMLTYSG